MNNRPCQSSRIGRAVNNFNFWESDFHNNRQNHRTPLRFLVKQRGQRTIQFCFYGIQVSDSAIQAFVKNFFSKLAGLIYQRLGLPSHRQILW